MSLSLCVCVCVCEAVRVCLPALFKLKKYINVDCACDWQFLPLLRRLHIAKTSSYTHQHMHRNVEGERDGRILRYLFVVLCFLHRNTHKAKYTDWNGRGIDVAVW